jgi:hypoxanthine phosphoribosyltransferase
MKFKTYAKDLSWNDFDNAVLKIANKFRGKVDGVYGVKRGGLCLAVALSHELEIPLVTFPNNLDNKILWVDDIIETGKTLKEYLPYNMEYACWVNVGNHNIYSVITSKKDEWIIFPWENKKRAISDMEAYVNSRK